MAMHGYGEKFDRAVKRVCRMHVRLRIIFSILGILLVYLCIPVIHASRGETPLFDKLNREWNLYLGFIMLGSGLLILLCSLVYRLPSIIIYNRVKERTVLISQYTDDKAKSTKKRWSKLRKQKKAKEIISLATSYWVLANRFIGKGKRKEGDSYFDGRVYQKFLLSLLAFFICLVSLFVLFPVAYILLAKWDAKHTVYDGKRLSFDGTYGDLFKRWVIYYGLIILTYGLFVFLLPRRMEIWRYRHTHIEGESACLGGTWKGNIILGLLFTGACNLFNILTLNLLHPLVKAWKIQYNQKRVYLDGSKLLFDGNCLQLLGKWVLWMLLCLITLFIFAFFIDIRMKKWTAKHTHLEEERQQIPVI